jgi:hypothetical protein
MLTIALAAAGSIGSGVIVAIITYLLTRQREREAEWRKLKFGQYQELLLAMSGIAEGRSTPETQARYADAFNSMSLVAPRPVLTALRDYQDEISCRNTARSLDEHDRLLNVLIRAMRADIFSEKKAAAREFEFRLITTPPILESGLV